MKHKNVTDGQASNSPRSLYAAMGLAQAGGRNYKTDNLEEYVASLKVMNMADLQNHAIKIGVKPKSDRQGIIRRLKQEFTKTQSTYKSAAEASKPKRPNKEDVDKRKKALEIMRKITG